MPPELKLFDTHAHYDDRRFDGDRTELLSSMPSRGVSLIMNPACNMRSSRESVALADRFSHVYAAVGVHPHDAKDMRDGDFDILRRLSENGKVLAVGEIGLDYHYDFSPRDVQKKRFREQMELARELGLPVIIHDREAHEDCFSIVSEFPGVTGVYHCYSGSAEHAKRILRIGYSLGFTGVITYKNARAAIETIKVCPRDRVLIETDAPYLTPEPFRRERNDSSYVALVAGKLAELWGVEPYEAAEITMRNGMKFFGIGL